MPGKVWDEITHLFPDFSGLTDEVLEWVKNFIPRSMMDVITYTLLGLKLIHVDKRLATTCKIEIVSDCFK